MGNPFVHLDLATGDLAAAKKFYKTIFDWKLRDMPAMGGYVGIDVGKGVGGGMGGKQDPNMPTSWTAYVGVADVKKTMAKAAAAGAQVIVDYMPIGDMGALGVFVDPTGATLGVWEEAKKKPAAKKAAARKPAAKQKAAKKPAAKRPAAKKPTAKKPTAKKKK
jgi:predicted enzyme related to lactoylglutathione lyase